MKAITSNTRDFIGNSPDHPALGKEKLNSKGQGSAKGKGHSTDESCSLFHSDFWFSNFWMRWFSVSAT
jgi:hypothetical protein